MSGDKPHFPSDDLKVDFGQVMKDMADPKKLDDFRRQEDERREKQMRERAEQARRDAIATFRPLVLRRSEGTMWECPGCGGLVLDREKHLDFHGVIGEAAQAAHDASWRMRPIG